MMKECTKCANQLADEQIFCPFCGTKQYTSMRETGINEDDEYIKIARCKWSRGLLNTNCQLCLMGNRLLLLDNSNQTLLTIRLEEILELGDFQPRIGTPKGKGLKINVKPNKTQNILLPTEMSDFVPYLKSMIMECRAVCLDKILTSSL